MISKALQCGTMTFSVGEEKIFIYFPFDISKVIDRTRPIPEKSNSTVSPWHRSSDFCLFTVRLYRIRQIKVDITLHSFWLQFSHLDLRIVSRGAHLPIPLDGGPRTSVYHVNAFGPWHINLPGGAATCGIWWLHQDQHKVVVNITKRIFLACLKCILIFEVSIGPS